MGLPPIACENSKKKHFHFQINSSLSMRPSYDIHSAGLTKQIKLVFKSDLSLFAKSNFFQISQNGKPQIQKLTNFQTL